MKKRILGLALLAAGFGGVVLAGDLSETVDELGDSARQPQAVEKLADAGEEAFDDLLAGLKLNPDEEGLTDGVEKARRSAIRLSCARLLGSLGDTRASADLLALLERESANRAGEPQVIQYPDFCAACSVALARIWGDKAGSAGRDRTLELVSALAADEGAGLRVRYSALRALALLKQGGEAAAPLLADDADPTLRLAAVQVLRAARHTESADRLLELWNAQRAGESRDYTKALGVACLFALASFEDERAVEGLVDVSTLGEFGRYPTLRREGRDLLGKFTDQAATRLVEVIRDDARVVQHSEAAITLGELGGKGVGALLDLAGQDAEGEDKLEKRVAGLLKYLYSDTAIEGFVEAWRTLPADAPARERILDRLIDLRPRQAQDLFREIAADTTVKAPLRARAIEAYADYHGKAAYDDLARWAKDGEAVVRASSVSCLGKSYIPLSKSKDLLKEAVADPDPETRSKALKGLQRSEDKEDLAVFVGALAGDADPIVRKAALEALEQFNRSAKLEEEGVLDPVRAATEDEDPTVRAAAIKVYVRLCKTRDEVGNAVEVVEKALKDEDDSVRSQAYADVYNVAAKIDPRAVIDAGLKETELSLKGSAVQAMSFLAEFPGELEAVVDLAVEVLKDRTNAHHAKVLLGKLKEAGQYSKIASTVRPMLEKESDAPLKDFRRLALLVDVLREIEDDKAFPLAKKLAEENDTELRRACVRLYKDLGDKTDVDFLRTLRDKGDTAADGVRNEIEEAIRTLESR